MATEDPVVVLSDVMSALNQLPCCSEDFLGEELYHRVSLVLGWDDDEEDEELDDDDTEDE